MGLLCCWENPETGKKECPAETKGDAVTLAVREGWETWQTHGGLRKGECRCPSHLSGASRKPSRRTPTTWEGRDG
jgi:hypothetical protein